MSLATTWAAPASAAAMATSPGPGGEVEHPAAGDQLGMVEQVAGQGLAAGPGGGPVRRRQGVPGRRLHPGPPDDRVLGQVQPHLGHERGRHQPEPVQAGAGRVDLPLQLGQRVGCGIPHRRKHAPGPGPGRLSRAARRVHPATRHGTSGQRIAASGRLLSGQVRGDHRPSGRGSPALNRERLHGNRHGQVVQLGKGLRLHRAGRRRRRTSSSTTRPSPRSGYRELNEGQKVEFEVTQGQKGPQADNVRPM